MATVVRLSGYTKIRNIVFTMGLVRSVTNDDLRTSTPWGRELLARDTVDVPVSSALSFGTPFMAAASAGRGVV